MALMWRRTHHTDPQAVALSDRHYSRQHPGSPEFTPPGYKVVLVLPNYRALWASHTGDVTVPRADGLECWSCREIAPHALDAIGRTEEAATLRALAPIVDQKSAYAAHYAADAAAAEIRASALALLDELIAMTPELVPT